MPYNGCSLIGTLLTASAVILLIFAQVGQISPATIPRKISIITISTSNFSTALAARTGISAGMANAIYASNATGAANMTYYTKFAGDNSTNGKGLQGTYEFGLWGYCATQGSEGDYPSYCSKTGLGARFTPVTALTDDVPARFQANFNTTLPDSVFRDEVYLSYFTHAAGIIIFVGSLFAAFAFILSLIPIGIFVLLASLTSMLAATLTIVGLIIYTVIISRVVAAINTQTVTFASTRSSDALTLGLGLGVYYGKGLWIAWGGAAALVFSIIPLGIACCVGRQKARTNAY